jgi:hypothetical protein
MRFADNRNDEWTTAADLEAARWLRAGYQPDQLHPATGVPLEGALEHADPDSDPSVAEAVLRTSDEVLEQTRRRCLIVRAVVAVALVAAVGVAVWLAGGR